MIVAVVTPGDAHIQRVGTRARSHGLVHEQMRLAIERVAQVYFNETGMSRRNQSPSRMTAEGCVDGSCSSGLISARTDRRQTAASSGLTPCARLRFASDPRKYRSMRPAELASCGKVGRDDDSVQRRHESGIARAGLRKCTVRQPHGQPDPTRQSLERIGEAFHTTGRPASCP